LVRAGRGVIWLFPALALLAIGAVLGTDRLGRPLTDEEKKRFGALLREHDYPGECLVALRFAYRLTQRRASARDLMGRAALRLVRQGWDPAEVSLKRRLCRLVWSEWTHAVEENEAAGRATERYFHELEATEGVSVPSAERRALDREASEKKRAHAQAQLDKLRAAFVKAGDEVNLLWLDANVEDVLDAQTMAQRTGRDVAEFYAAAKRRKRAVRRLVAEENGAPYNEEES
jgi:hypothetical protein